MSRRGALFRRVRELEGRCPTARGWVSWSARGSKPPVCWKAISSRGGVAAPNSVREARPYRAKATRRHRLRERVEHRKIRSPRRRRQTRCRRGKTALSARSLGRSRGKAPTLLRGHLPDLQRAILDLALQIFELHAALLSRAFCLSKHRLRLARSVCSNVLNAQAGRDFSADTPQPAPCSRLKQGSTPDLVEARDRSSSDAGISGDGPVNARCHLKAPTGLRRRTSPSGSFPRGVLALS
jgi:hypothetical protein